MVRKTSTNRIAASDFKAKCLSLLDEVAEKGSEFGVTKRGKAVARLVPMETGWKSLKGSVLYQADEIITPDEEGDMEKNTDSHFGTSPPSIPTSAPRDP